MFDMHGGFIVNKCFDGLVDFEVERSISRAIEYVDDVIAIAKTEQGSTPPHPGSPNTSPSHRFLCQAHNALYWHVTFPRVHFIYAGKRFISSRIIFILNSPCMPTA